MLSLSRTAVKRGSLQFSRSFAEAANAEAQHEHPAPSLLIKGERSHGRRRIPKRVADLPPLPQAKVPVSEKHGLYAFFRRKSLVLEGEDAYEVVESPEQGQLATGRAWEAAELRNKSFKDLHTLWYVVLRERNLLATQKEEARRMGVASSFLQVPADKVRNCRKTMARIKAVLNERRLAYEGAVQLAQEQAASANYAQHSLKRITQRGSQGNPQPEPHYRPSDNRVLLIGQPPSMPKPKPSQAPRKAARAAKGTPQPKPQPKANPYNKHRAYGNYRVSQIDAP